MSGRVILMASTCDQVQELLPAYDDGDLALDEQRRLERHVGSCQECRLLLQGIRSSWERLGEWTDLEPSPSYRQDFWKAVGRDDERRRWGPLRFLVERRWVPASAAAVLLLGFAGGLLWGGRVDRPVGNVALSAGVSRTVAQVAMVAQSLPAPEVPVVGEVDGPFTPELLDEALSSSSGGTQP